MTFRTRLENLIRWAPFTSDTFNTAFNNEQSRHNRLRRKNWGFAQEFLEYSHVYNSRRQHITNYNWNAPPGGGGRGITLDALVNTVDSYRFAGGTNSGNPVWAAIKRFMPYNRMVLNADARKEVAIVASRVLEDMINPGRCGLATNGTIGTYNGNTYNRFDPEEFGTLLSRYSRNKEVKAAVTGLFDNLHNGARHFNTRYGNAADRFAVRANRNMYSSTFDRLAPGSRAMSAVLDTSIIVAGLEYGAAAGLYAGLRRYAIPKFVQAASQGIADGAGVLANLVAPRFAGSVRNFATTVGNAAMTGDYGLGAVLLGVNAISALTSGRRGVLGQIGDALNMGTQYGLMLNGAVELGYTHPGRDVYVIGERALNAADHALDAGVAAAGSAINWSLGEVGELGRSIENAFALPSLPSPTGYVPPQGTLQSWLDAIPCWPHVQIQTPHLEIGTPHFRIITPETHPEITIPTPQFYIPMPDWTLDLRELCEDLGNLFRYSLPAPQAYAPAPVPAAPVPNIGAPCPYTPHPAPYPCTPHCGA